jgi:hypothetical protein
MWWKLNAFSEKGEKIKGTEEDGENSFHSISFGKYIYSLGNKEGA